MYRKFNLESVQDFYDIFCTRVSIVYGQREEVRKWGVFFLNTNGLKGKIPQKNSTQEPTTVILTLWESSMDIWVERYAAHHGSDDKETRTIQCGDLNDLIVCSYQLDKSHLAFAHTPPLFKSPTDPGCAQSTES
jgi:hypothetical protein